MLMAQNKARKEAGRGRGAGIEGAASTSGAEGVDIVTKGKAAILAQGGLSLVCVQTSSRVW